MHLHVFELKHVLTSEQDMLDGTPPFFQQILHVKFSTECDRWQQSLNQDTLPALQMWHWQALCHGRKRPLKFCKHQ